MKAVQKIWNMIGNNNQQRFWRLIILIITITICFNLAVNVGYDKSKGGWYWKPFDIHAELKK
jgi:anti-sigma-K factor RskA